MEEMKTEPESKQGDRKLSKDALQNSSCYGGNKENLPPLHARPGFLQISENVPLLAELSDHLRKASVEETYGTCFKQTATTS